MIVCACGLNVSPFTAAGVLVSRSLVPCNGRRGPCTNTYARRHAHGSQTGRSERMLLVQKLKGCPQTSDPMTHYPRVLDSEVLKGVIAEILESVLLHSGSVLACG